MGDSSTCSGGGGRRLAQVSDPGWSKAGNVSVAILGVIVGTIVALIFVYALQLALAPRAQREEARERLRDIRGAANSYSIVPLDVTLDERAPGGYSVRLEIENRGRGAKFAALIESIEGSQQPLHNPHSHLAWVGRPGVIDEEIPPGETRLIVVGFVARSLGTVAGYEFYETKPDGTPLEPNFPQRLVPGVTTLWCRISARNIPEIGYSRRIGVEVVIEGTVTADVRVAADPPDAERMTSVPSLERLLDY